jgi:transposase
VDDRIGVPLELEGFGVLGSEVVDGVLEVAIRATTPACCFHCGSVDVVGHGRSLRRIRDRAAVYPTVLVGDQRRFRCRDCGRTSREQHREVAGRRRVTRRFLRHLGELAVGRPWVEVASDEAVSWWRVASAFDLLAATEPQYSGAPPRVLSLDESAFRRRLGYHTVVSDPEGRGVLDMVEGRNQRSAEEAISRLPQQWIASVETMVIDCYWPYRKAIEHLLPGVRIVADKFHVLRSVDAAAQKVRVRHGRRRLVAGRDGGLSRQHNPRFDPRIAALAYGKGKGNSPPRATSAAAGWWKNKETSPTGITSATKASVTAAASRCFVASSSAETLSSMVGTAQQRTGPRCRPRTSSENRCTDGSDTSIMTA